MAASGGPNRVHHTAVVVEDMERSLRFWRDGMALDVVMDQVFTGDWPTLFGAPSDRLRSVFLGDAEHPGSGLVELVSFLGADHPVPAPGEPELAGAGPAGAGPSTGLFLLSLYVDLDRTLDRLEGLGTVPRSIIEVSGISGPVRMATVLAPDGVLVELIDSPS